MQNLKRNINMGFRVTQKEYDLIIERMNSIGFSSIRAYLLKMALNGMIVNLDLSQVNECSRLLKNVSNNINQIARKTNETGNAYPNELAEIQTQLGEVWKQQDKTYNVLADLLEVF